MVILVAECLTRERLDCWHTAQSPVPVGLHTAYARAYAAQGMMRMASSAEPSQWQISADSMLWRPNNLRLYRHERG